VQPDTRDARWILSPSAAADIEETAAYIASDDPTAAVHVVEDLLAAIELLAGRPGIGHRRDDLSDQSLLTWPVHKLVIIYRSTATHIEIVAIVSGYRDLTALHL